ncbi:hypothetical protein [Sorangium sp. So ce388]|uniref:hypothetical protein n=1 Tax=Sorangium sp. So ce388 TaxID=3133309 RepID=UPI003F5B82E5
MTCRPQASDISLAVAARSEPGPCRDHNEDTFQILDLARGASLGPPAAQGCLVGSAFVLGVYDGCGRGPPTSPATSPPRSSTRCAGDLFRRTRKNQRACSATP